MSVSIEMRSFSKKDNRSDLIKKINKIYVDQPLSPQLFQILTAPFDLIRNTFSLKRSKKINCPETILDSRLHLAFTPVNATYSVASLMHNARQVGLVFSKSIERFIDRIPIVGVITSSVAAAIEVKNIRREVSFISHCNHFLRITKEDPEAILNEETLGFFKKFTDLERVDMQELTRLANRVMPWFAAEIATKLPLLVQDLENPEFRDEALQKIILLIEDAKIQAQKKFIVHSVSFIINLFILTAFTLILASQPYLIPAVLFWITLVMGIANGVFSGGTLQQRGWEFSAADLIPTWVYSANRYLHSIIFPKIKLTGMDFSAQP